MSKKRAIITLNLEELEEKNKCMKTDKCNYPKRNIIINEKYNKDYIVYHDNKIESEEDDEYYDDIINVNDDETILSNSLSSLSLEDEKSSNNTASTDEDDITEEELKDILNYENKNNDENLEKLNEELNIIATNIKDKKVTLTKILKSNLNLHEKERAVELFGVLSSHDPNSLEYLNLNKVIYTMINNIVYDNSNIDDKIKILNDKIKDDIPTMEKIINAKISEQDKISALEMFNTFSHLSLTDGLYSRDWFILKKKIITIINNTINNDEEYRELEQKEKELKLYNIDNDNQQLKYKILNLEADMKIKKKIYTMYEEMNNTGDDQSKEQLYNKIKWLVSLPHERVMIKNVDCNNIKEYCTNVYKKLDDKIYGMYEVKERILLHINNKIKANNNTSIIALKGEPGVGKTKLVKSLAEAVDLPFSKISFGGAIDSSILIGSNSVWNNSSPGILLQTLAQHKYSNIIILLDEIDKLASSSKGIEVENSLLQILDYTQNNSFNDSYLNEYGHNLSNIWFIATMNSDEGLSQPLKDRLEIINVPSYNKEDMVKIIIKYTLPDACIKCGLKLEDLKIEESACYFLLNQMSNEIKSSGLRQLEREIVNIVSKLNLLNNISDTSDFNLSFKLNDFKNFPYIINKSTIKSLTNFKSNNNNDTYKHMYM